MPDDVKPYTDEELNSLLEEFEDHTDLGSCDSSLHSDMFGDSGRFLLTIKQYRRKLALAVDALRAIVEQDQRSYCQQCSASMEAEEALAAITASPDA